MKKSLLIPENIQSNNFDLLRFLLASSVIVCHCYAIYYGWDRFYTLEPFMKWSSGKISIGSFAVNYFFVISGFLIVRSFEYSTDFIDYIKKRILRIYPGFIVVFFLAFFVFGPIGHMKEFSFSAYTDFFKQVPFKREIANMISLQSPLENRYFTHLPQSGLNNSLWTIQFEFICYLLTPVIFWISIRKQKFWLLIVLLLSYILFGLQSLNQIFPFKQSLNGHIIENPFYIPRFLTYFLFGSCVYIYRKNIPRNGILAIIAFIGFIIAFKLKLVDILWPVTGTYLLFYFAYHPKLVFHKFAKYGDFSYGIYLYGWPLQQLVMLFLWPHLNPWRFFIIVFPIVLFFAFLSWKLVERPALNLKKKKFNLLFNFR